MLPATAEGLLIILVADVPGYIAVTLWARTKTGERPPTDLTLLLLAIIFSAVTQAVLFLPLTLPFIYPIKDELVKHPISVAIWVVIALIVVPTLGGIYVGRLTDFFLGARRAVTNST